MDIGLYWLTLVDTLHMHSASFANEKMHYENADYYYYWWSVFPSTILQDEKKIYIIDIFAVIKIGIF